MSAIIHEKHLRDFFASFGVTDDSLSDYTHGDLVGMAMALLDNECMAGYDPTKAHTYSYVGYGTGVQTIASAGVLDDTRGQEIDAGTVALRLAEHTTARVIEQVQSLDHKPDSQIKEIPFIPTVMHLLWAAGTLLALMNVKAEPAHFRGMLKEVQGHITDGRKGLDDIKRGFRARQVAV